MKIEYIVGDLFTTEDNFIAHGCNCKGVMGAGVALLIKKKYPHAFRIYKEHFFNGNLNLGQVISVNTNNKTILNCVTQDRYGRSGTRLTDYDAVRECMNQVNVLAKNDRVSMPLIGAGLGGGDWNVISKIIEEELTDVQPVVYQLHLET